MMRHSFKKEGFTLVEIMAVVIIVSIIVAFAIPKYIRIIERARISNAQEILGQIFKAEMRHGFEHGNFSTPFCITALGLGLKITPNALYGSDWADDGIFWYNTLGKHDGGGSFAGGHFSAFGPTDCGSSATGALAIAYRRNHTPGAGIYTADRGGVTPNYIIVLLQNGSFVSDSEGVDTVIFNGIGASAGWY